MNQLTDEALWQYLKQGNSKAFDELFNRYWKKLFTSTHAYLKDREKCMEIVHDIFLNIWLKRNQLDIVCFEAYVSAASRYHVYKQLKGAGSIQYSIDPEFFSAGNNYNHGEERLRYRELETAIEIHLDALPKRCVEIYNLSRKDALSNNEIASLLGISKRTVENQLTHALKHIRVLLSSGYWFVFAFIVFALFVLYASINNIVF